MREWWRWWLLLLACVMRVSVWLPLLLGPQSRFPHDVIMMIPGDLSQAAEKDASGDTGGKGVEPNKKPPVVEAEGKKNSKKKLSKKERFVASRNVSRMLALHKCISRCNNVIDMFTSM